jgi:hypothetical protein
MTFLKTTALALILSAGLFMGSSHAATSEDAASADGMHTMPLASVVHAQTRTTAPYEVALTYNDIPSAPTAQFGPAEESKEQRLSRLQEELMSAPSEDKLRIAALQKEIVSLYKK